MLEATMRLARRREIARLRPHLADIKRNPTRVCHRIPSGSAIRRLTGRSFNIQSPSGEHSQQINEKKNETQFIVNIGLQSPTNLRNLLEFLPFLRSYDFHEFVNTLLLIDINHICFI